MSRSYKKNLWYKLVGRSSTQTFWKRHANKKVRRTPDIADGGAYHKVSDPWNICDGKWLYDPRPRWYAWKQEWIDPDPVWKVRMK